MCAGNYWCFLDNFVLHPDGLPSSNVLHLLPPLPPLVSLGLAGLSASFDLASSLDGRLHWAIPVQWPVVAATLVEWPMDAAVLFSSSDGPPAWQLLVRAGQLQMDSSSMDASMVGQMHLISMGAAWMAGRILQQLPMCFELGIDQKGCQWHLFSAPIPPWPPPHWCSLPATLRWPLPKCWAWSAAIWPGIRQQLGKNTGRAQMSSTGGDWQSTDGRNKGGDRQSMDFDNNLGASPSPFMCRAPLLSLCPDVQRLCGEEMLRWEVTLPVNGLCGIHHCPSPNVCYQAARFETPDELKLCLEPGLNPNNMQRTISFDSHWFYILAFWSLACTFVAGAAFSCFALYLCHRRRGGRENGGLVAIGRNTLRRLRALGSQRNQRQQQAANNASMPPNNLVVNQVANQAGPSAASNRFGAAELVSPV